MVLTWHECHFDQGADVCYVAACIIANVQDRRHYRLRQSQIEEGNEQS